MADLTKQWPCEDKAYDLISCNLVLEHIPDLAHIFSEAARVLRSGGKFLINELHPFQAVSGPKARFERGDRNHRGGRIRASHLRISQHRLEKRIQSGPLQRILACGRQP
ncbi:methyltransferase domain-containing protein [Candidatus Villigracilis affinis]|uniref:class I SAM-dependent methyltransferase n=1 Tax=Candidatus Villigracilis affinis TaxID=3140682 RepID=UPI0031F0E1F5